VEIPDLDHGDGTSGDTLVPIAPVTARLMNGALCAIAVGDPPGQDLLAGVALLGLTNPLFYHCNWQNVTYNGATVQALSNFAFQATTATPVSGLGATGSTTGGTLAANTYYYGVTALLPGIETLVCAPVSVTTTGSTSQVALAWSTFVNQFLLNGLGGNPAYTEVLGYNVYRGTAANAMGLLATTTAVHYADTGAVSPGATIAPALDLVDLTDPALPRFEYGGPI
jgi:hypothetical protein